MKLYSIIAITALLALAVPPPLFAAKDPAKAAGKGKGDPAQQAARKANHQALVVFDSNDDGTISGDEGALLRSAFAAKKTGPFKPLDLNADGTLDDNEVAAIKGGKHGKAGKGEKKKKKTA